MTVIDFNVKFKAGFHMIADDRKKGCFHIITTIAEPTAGIRFGQRKRQIYMRV